MVTERKPRSRSTAPSRVPAQRRASKPPVSAAVDRWLGSLELDDDLGARAAIARALAQKLDEAVSSELGPAALAAAGIARELRDTLDSIRDSTDTEATDFVADIFKLSR